MNSTLSAAEVSARMAAVERGEMRMLYVAPERFDLGRSAERLRDVGVSLLAVDEAHCISEWGHDFRPSYLRVREVRSRLGNPPTVALTATATPEVREDIARQLALREPEVVITGFDRTNLSYHVMPARNDAAKDALLIELLGEHLRTHADGVAIVYASTRKTVERIAGVLTKARLPVLAYHAGLDDEHRAEVQDAFMREQVRIIVATNAFGMGIDKPNVRLVVHHAMPGTLEAYYQEAGRGGRDGLPATAVLLHAFPDRFTHEFFIKGALPAPDTVAAVHAALQASEKGIPFMPVRGIVGSDLLEHRDDWTAGENPFDAGYGPLVLVKAIKPDVALFHVPLADKHGNVWVGVRREMMTMAHAAKAALVTYEELYDGNLLTDPQMAPGTIPALYVSALAEAKQGAWPGGLFGRYPADAAHMAEYVELARTEAGFASYLDRFVTRRRAAE